MYYTVINPIRRALFETPKYWSAGRTGPTKEAEEGPAKKKERRV